MARKTNKTARKRPLQADKTHKGVSVQSGNIKQTKLYFLSFDKTLQNFAFAAADRDNSLWKSPYFPPKIDVLHRELQ
ncbi:hypothetical protein CLI84_08815 [Porphyromonas gingivalis]|nr:hypothetical protein CLI84_08815 [Porphyromonas gingivalis]